MPPDELEMIIFFEKFLRLVYGIPVKLGKLHAPCRVGGSMRGVWPTCAFDSLEGVRARAAG